MSLRELQNYTFISRYARYNKEKKRRETWKESTDRVRDMMLQKYAGLNVDQDINWAYDMMYKKRMLGSQRALQFGGKPILKHSEKIYNCLKNDTKFITSHGVKSFKDFSDGDTVIVLTHLGNWKPAIVRCYGKQKLYKISLSRRSNNSEIFATSNHRWILSDGTETTTLKVGDKLACAPNIFTEFNYYDSEPDERLYWAYGFVYGDGTKVKDSHGKYKYSMVRLCGKDVQYKDRFEELGFKTSSPKSCNGDVMVYTGKYLKEAPNPEIDNPRLIRAFVRGYLDADGGKNSNDTDNLFTSIQSSERDHIDFIRQCFPIAGAYLVSEKDLTGQITNFGERPTTSLFRVCNNIDGKYAAKFTVESIEENVEEDVWCLEVEDDHSFVIPNGLVTGNCTASYCNRPRFFQEALFLLLNGCGVGFSVQKHHVAQLPKMGRKVNGDKTYSIPDTIEGWSDALGILISSYLSEKDAIFSEYAACNVTLDFSLIRPEGSPLSSSSGKAPGPEPLRKALQKIKSILDDIYIDGGVFTPIQAYDIVMHAADAVISGGVRRSATIVLFSLDDQEMMQAKTGNWFYENPQRGRSNNSVVLLRGETSWKEFAEIIKSTREFGEPGFFWCDDLETLTNPCVEIGLYAYDDKGNSGWEMCNLSTINCSKVTNEDEFYEACKAAAIIGTLQAGFNTFPYLGNTTEKIVQREALLGVSMTGIMENPHITLDPEIQRKGASIVKKINKELSKKIGINPAARTTCVKPEGSSSCLLGTSSGIHPHHAKRYIRNVQANINEKPYQLFADINPFACEPSVWSANNTDAVISFTVEVPDGAKLKNQVPALELLENVVSTQRNWVLSGTNRELCTQPWLNHNVSNTVVVKEDEWDDVADFIFKNRKYLTGVSLLPHTGDKDYPQAPFTAVYTPKEIVSMYGEGGLFCSGLIEEALTLFNDNLWYAADAALGLNDEVINCINKKDARCVAINSWVKKLERFAKNYFGGDVKKATYCMKDVYNWKKYTDLTRQYRPVNFEELFEDQDDTKPMAEIACSGGACEIR